MCGIAGLIGVDPDIGRDVSKRMMAALRHRGPNDQGIGSVVSRDGTVPPAVLVHTRLSIIDLSPAGHQPMADRPLGSQRPNHVVFNGEIYNHESLRAELEAAGQPSHRRCDTEVILQGYRAWGEAAVERFEGMFAFCLLDAERDRVWLCRDRMGIKPLYLFRPRTGGLVFASEVRGILAARPELVEGRLNRAALESFLAQGAVIGRDSIVEGITMLPAGESMLCDFSGRSVRSRTYWLAPFAETKPRSGGTSRLECVAELNKALRTSVKDSLVADVPVGLFLSGGIDSAAIATIATEVETARVHTLSIGFDVAAYDETAEADQVARKLGTEHRTVKLSGLDAVAAFDDVFASADQPTVDGFNTYFVSRAAHDSGLTVALSGLGGDELFGGYATFRDLPKALGLAKLTSLLPAVSRRIAPFARHLPNRSGLKLSSLLEHPADLLRLYLLRRELLLKPERRALQQLPSRSDPWSGVSEKVLEDARSVVQGIPDTLDRVSWLECSIYMANMLLRDSDVFSMANAIELRVPLLERAVVESAARARAEWRRADPRSKPLLLDAVGSRLPPEVWSRKKRGFTFPWSEWLRGPLAARCEAAVVDTRKWQSLGFDTAEPRRLWKRFKNADPAVGGLQMLALLALSDYAERNQLSI